ncbi:hypothetical protein QBC35DRAFT_526383 [Podospora australis]|uniref:C2H2-type domain-containing protein n=1 Tax=Podospora australis TaxID=1536484 RepID=A0AAN6WJD4_9PEZI|nr:hypothetical protein QBC35DRAFT_526383 [Podospora australis]
MELARVDALVDSLASAFDTGLELYTTWKQRQETENHYHGHKRAASTGPTKCAVSTSLDISSYRIRSTYQIGFTLIGPDFAAGDDLTRLIERVSRLGEAVNTKQRHPINLNEVYLASEEIRIRSVSALAGQYRRLAIGRLVPQELPIPKTRVASLWDEPDSPTQDQPPQKEFDSQTAIWSTNSEYPTFQSEPPSPPLTPKASKLPMASADPCLSPISDADTTPTQKKRGPLRPKNSVFSMFCPDAMALQVDPSRAIPSRSKCSCGYKWKLPEITDGKDHIPLKDGFRMTRRFLAKSHCDQTRSNTDAPSDGQTKPAYGCVLCTSTGHTDAYTTAEDLANHINAVHGKWQMLHDKDIV